MMEIEELDVSSSDEEKKENEKHQRQRIPNSVRWRIIGYLDSGKSQLEAVTKYGVSQGSVSKIFKKFKEKEDVKSKKRIGPPKK